MRSAKQLDTKPIRVLVGDASLMVCGLVLDRLKRNSQFEVAGYATSAAELLRLISSARPDVALIGCGLDDGPLSGVYILPEIRTRNPEVRLVLLIDRSVPEIVVPALRAGVRGVFAHSEAHFKLLCKCIRCVHEGQIWANTEHLEFMVHALAQTPLLRVVNANGDNLLTKREEELVRLVQEGLGNRDIAQRLSLSENTVKNYMFRIFEKLGVSNRVELVLYAMSTSKQAEKSAALRSA